MTEEQEQARLSELRTMAEMDTGSVSLLSYEAQQRSKIGFAKRLRAARIALRRIEADPTNAQAIAAAALADDASSI